MTVIGSWLPLAPLTVPVKRSGGRSLRVADASVQESV